MELQHAVQWAFGVVMFGLACFGGALCIVGMIRERRRADGSARHWGHIDPYPLTRAESAAGICKDDIAEPYSPPGVMWRYTDEGYAKAQAGGVVPFKLRAI
jgi:hypothetical protein